LLAAHLGSLVFGLIGILIMLPHPDLWNSDPVAVHVFTYSMDYAGSLYIILGAATMFLAAGASIGWRNTVIFAIISSTLSLTSELVGTGTGWPFGNYAYTDFLGYKVLGRVPYSIPLSWFYMGMASYLLGIHLASRLGVRHRTAWALGFGVWFLTVWDLVLDPAMANHALRIQFWVWHTSGSYFGMPIQNLVGWSVTGLVFMSLSRLLWRKEVAFSLARDPMPLLIYGANLAFAMILSLGVNLWMPVVLSAVLGLLPAAFATGPDRWFPVRHLRWIQDA
jgi:putative membrane protein